MALICKTQRIGNSINGIIGVTQQFHGIEYFLFQNILVRWKIEIAAENLVEIGNGYFKCFAQLGHFDPLIYMIVDIRLHRIDKPEIPVGIALSDCRQAGCGDPDDRFIDSAGKNEFKFVIFSVLICNSEAIHNIMPVAFIMNYDWQILVFLENGNDRIYRYAFEVKEDELSSFRAVRIVFMCIGQSHHNAVSGLQREFPAILFNMKDSINHVQKQVIIKGISVIVEGRIGEIGHIV